jgi:hypothetical protein
VARDVKEIVGTLMRVIGGAEISPDEVEELTFTAGGRLRRAMNEAFIKLLEFAHDRDARSLDPDLDNTMRETLRQCLEAIVEVAGQSNERKR